MEEVIDGFQVLKRVDYFLTLGELALDVLVLASDGCGWVPSLEVLLNVIKEFLWDSPNQFQHPSQSSVIDVRESEGE